MSYLSIITQHVLQFRNLVNNRIFNKLSQKLLNSKRGVLKKYNFEYNQQDLPCTNSCQINVNIIVVTFV